MANEFIQGVATQFVNMLRPAKIDQSEALPRGPSIRVSEVITPRHKHPFEGPGTERALLGDNVALRDGCVQETGASEAIDQRAAFLTEIVEP